MQQYCIAWKFLNSRILNSVWLPSFFFSLHFAFKQPTNESRSIRIIWNYSLYWVDVFLILLSWINCNWYFALPNLARVMYHPFTQILSAAFEDNKKKISDYAFRQHKWILSQKGSVWFLIGWFLRLLGSNDCLCCAKKLMWNCSAPFFVNGPARKSNTYQIIMIWIPHIEAIISRFTTSRIFVVFTINALQSADRIRKCSTL